MPAIDDTASVLAVIRETYADWSPALVEMLTQVSPGFHRWPLSVMPPDVNWETKQGLTIIGDASHAMPPFTGKGVNLAMLDALELADALAADPDAALAAALATFEFGMQARTRRETGADLEVGHTFYGIDLASTPSAR
jgi:2-polyprenyl-6-methoxyphenol hydroxylase-like FAD-dependent oxidoreductase